MVLLFIYTLDVLLNKFDLDADSLYNEYLVYLEDLEEEGERDPDERKYSKREVFTIFYLVKGLSILVIPASIYVYRSRIISLPAFVSIKKH